MNINEINTSTKEGKLLMMALAALTVSPSICINGHELDGRKMTPDEMLTEISKTADLVYNDQTTNV